VGGSAVGKLFKVGTARVSIGRSPDNDIVLDDEGVARRHAFIETEPGALVLIDGERLGGGYIHRSTEGTYVNGKPIERRRLRDGDVIRFSPGVELRYFVTDPSGNAATRDVLTGLYNKLYFIRRLTTELAAQRTLKQPLSIAMVDVDNSRALQAVTSVNAAEQVLVGIARTIAHEVRPDDVVARYGGDELAILLPNTDAKQAQLACERVRKAVEKLRIQYDDNDELHTTISLGTATSTGDVEDWRSFLGIAESMLAAAKRNGKNRTEPAT
jgi:diguanylate cyclase (GGDEF)-like protein